RTRSLSLHYGGRRANLPVSGGLGSWAPLRQTLYRRGILSRDLQARKPRSFRALLSRWRLVTKLLGAGLLRQDLHVAQREDINATVLLDSHRHSSGKVIDVRDSTLGSIPE